MSNGKFLCCLGNSPRTTSDYSDKSVLVYSNRLTVIKCIRSVCNTTLKVRRPIRAASFVRNELASQGPVGSLVAMRPLNRFHVAVPLLWQKCRDSQSTASIWQNEWELSSQCSQMTEYIYLEKVFVILLGFSYIPTRIFKIPTLSLSGFLISQPGFHKIPT